MVGDCFDLLTTGQPVLKAYQGRIIISTKLILPPRTEDIYFSEYTLICPWQSMVKLSVILSVILSYGHTVGHMVILSVVLSFSLSYGHTVILSVILSYGHTRSHGHTVILSVILLVILSNGHTVGNTVGNTVSYGHRVIRSYCLSYVHTVGPLYGCLQLYLALHPFLLPL